MPGSLFPRSLLKCYFLEDLPSPTVLNVTSSSIISIICCCSVAKSCLRQQHGLQHARLPSFTIPRSLLKFMSIALVDAIHPSHPLPPPSPFAFSLSQHQGLSRRVGSSQQVVKILALQLQQQSFQCIFSVDFL